MTLPHYRDTRLASSEAGATVLPATQVWRQFLAAVRDRDRLRAYALAPWLRPWGEESGKLQASFDAAARAPSREAEEQRKRQHASRQHIGKLAVSLLKRGLAAEEIALRLRAENAALLVPLPKPVLIEVARRAVERFQHGG